jgi:hypothetical protein
VVDDARLERLRRKHRPKVYPSRTDLLESLTSRSARQFEAGLEAAQRAGVDGESALVEALDQVARTRRPDIVSALRGATGRLDSTDALLQRLVREESGPGSVELRVMAMGSLAARAPGDAVSVLVRVLREEPNGELKDYALRYLAAVADESAIPEGHHRLQTQSRRPTRDMEGRITALAYLGQHVAPATSEMTDLVCSVRKHWRSVHPQLERPWLARHWPGIAPEGPPPPDVPGPDAQALRNWARSTMLLPNSTDARGP